MFGNLMLRLKNWYFRGYENRKHDIQLSVVSRFARGNTLVQEGRYIDEKELEKLSKEGDRALERLESAAQ